MVKRYRVRRDEGTGGGGGRKAPGASDPGLIPAGGWGGALVKAHPSKVKGLGPVVKRYRVRRDRGTWGVAMPPGRRTGPSYMRGGVVACPKRRDASPGRGPPHGRR